MKYALIDGERQEAQPGYSGLCPVCKSLVVAKCGDIRVHHWAHRGRRDCDPWWENETEWHRNWKNKFPSDWQEIPHAAGNGEVHRADVKTDQGWVLEFQYSKINPDERESRETFYQQLIWVVNGTRRKRDKQQFLKALKTGGVAIKEWNLLKIPFPDEYAILRDWIDSKVPVLFDFSEDGKPEETHLWCLIRVINGIAYIGPFSREDFIKYHSPGAKKCNLDFSELFNNINEGIEIINQPRRVRTFDPLAAKVRKLQNQTRQREVRRHVSGRRR